MREMIRNEVGIRVVPHIIVRASMQIACCSLSGQREKLSTKSTQLLSSEENPVGNFCDQHQTCWWLWLQLRCFFCFEDECVDDFYRSFRQNVFLAIAHLNFGTFAQLLRVKLFKVPPSSNYFPAVSKNTRFLFVNHQHWSLMTNDGCIVLAFTTTGV